MRKLYDIFILFFRKNKYNFIIINFKFSNFNKLYNINVIPIYGIPIFSNLKKLELNYNIIYIYF